MPRLPAPIAALALAAAAATVVPASAQSIGVVGPFSDQLELLGAQLRQGVEVAAPTVGLSTSSLTFADDACSAEAGAAAARQMVDAGVDIVVGFLCTESIEAAMPALAEAGIPVITPGVRTDSLTDTRERTGWPVFRTAPRAGDEQAAVSELLVPRWRDALFALVDDGTIYGRELTESFRLSAETAGLAAIFVDTYRPQMDNQIGLVARLRRAGATHVLVGGDRSDIAIMARDAAELGYDLTIAGGESLRAAPGDVPLAEGVLMVGAPEPASIAGPEALAAFDNRGIVPEGYALPAFAATEIAAEALGTARAEGIGVAEALDRGAFDTALGPVAFDDNGDLEGNPYRLLRFDGQSFVEVE